jgi:selenocysteine lyase/cysteine desulfurase
VTGTVQRVREIGRIAREHGIPFLVDAAQAVGHVAIDVQADGIDVMAAPGHKGLLGPLGTGVLYVRPGIENILATLKEGGSGSVSEQDTQPQFMPDKYEVGSHNGIGIAGLSAGVQWILDRGIESLAQHDRLLIKTFVDAMKDVEGVRYFGPQGVENRTGVFSVRIGEFTPHELATILETQYGILSRPGIHCAPRAHETIGTTQFGGTTRLSLGAFVTPEDVKYAASSLAEIAQQCAVTVR